MKRTLTVTVLAIIFCAALFSVEPAQAFDPEPPPIVIIHKYPAGGGSDCDSELNVTENGYVYADCNCWDIAEGGSRCYGCSDDSGFTWEMCTDYMSESTSGTSGKTDSGFDGRPMR